MFEFISTTKAYINFALGLRGFLKNPITIEDAKVVISHQIAHREENFLRTLKTNVFEYPRSPYIPLFNMANITFTDVERLVTQQGLENTLEELYDAGIYVTFEEIKGRKPIIRGDLLIPVNATDFDSPDLNPIMFGQSGGSTGIPTRTKMDLQHIAYESKYLMLCFVMYDLIGVPSVVWRGLLPDTGGLTNILRLAHMGTIMEHWFSTVRIGNTGLRQHYSVLSYLIIIMSRMYGFRFPFPEFVTLDDPLPIVKWAVDAVQRKGRCLIRASVSKAVRISLTAQKHGIDLLGVVFHGAGEPPTIAKVNAIQESGAKYIVHFYFTEAGVVGLACGNPKSADDMHFMSNHMALIQRPVEVFDQTVNAFCLTTLAPYTPKTLINVQSDDFGVIEQRACGCLLHQLGLSTHISQVRSYQKLTGEGMTLVGSDMVHIIEEVLPKSFGGGPLYYQLVEEETIEGMTKLVLYVDPSVNLVNEDDLYSAFLDAMRESMPSARLAQAEYRYGDVIKIRRQQPIRNSRNKHFPIRTLHKQG